MYKAVTLKQAGQILLMPSHRRNWTTAPFSLTALATEPLICVARTLLVLVYTDGVITMDSFLLQFFPSVLANQKDASDSTWCTFRSPMLQLFTSILFLTSIVGGLSGEYITKAYGRAKTIQLGGLLAILASLISGEAKSISVLLLGRALMGIAVGFESQACTRTHAFVNIKYPLPQRLAGQLHTQ